MLIRAFPWRLTLQATFGSLIRRFFHTALPSELPCGSLSRRNPAPRFPSGLPAAWVRAPAPMLGCG
jgi:hypothetical protein